MHVLTITNENGRQIARVEIKRVDPSQAVLAVLRAVSELPEERKERSDKGKKRLTIPE